MRVPSQAFCLLAKLINLRLTMTQILELLDSDDNLYVQAVGLLYIRYTANPKDLWRWFANFVENDHEFAPSIDSSKRISLGEYCHNILTDISYYRYSLTHLTTYSLT